MSAVSNLRKWKRRLQVREKLQKFGALQNNMSAIAWQLHSAPVVVD